MSRWTDGVSLFVNATPADGIDHYDIWHNGGPGGCMLRTHSEESAAAIVSAIEELHLLRKVAAMARQAYRADAVAEWFDSEGDGLKAALRELKDAYPLPEK
jgi:hypothetical protein